MNKKEENILFYSWVFAFLGTIGSLYFSVIRGYVPCELCWYQRIFMYPMSVILFISIWKKDTSVWIYSLILSGIGIILSSFHYSIQKLAFFTNSIPSCGETPCSGEYINWLGFVTIPFLSLTTFVIIFICSLWIKKLRKEEPQ
ncbi:disulfide oxidoreductase [Bacillus sp. 2205SS5-2]|uniref:disulfide oxidoreductase n=1 Tax=Bacillus sp. 2205SS5-2 TaxID=3109031 RepID=UPI00300781F4